MCYYIFCNKIIILIYIVLIVKLGTIKFNLIMNKLIIFLHMYRINLCTCALSVDIQIVEKMLLKLY